MLLPLKPALLCSRFHCLGPKKQNHFNWKQIFRLHNFFCHSQYYFSSSSFCKTCRELSLHLVAQFLEAPLLSFYKLGSDLVLQPPKTWVDTVRLELVRTHSFSRQAHGATLGRIFFCSGSPKSDKQWKVLRDCLENFPTGGPLGNQTLKLH